MLWKRTMSWGGWVETTSLTGESFLNLPLRPLFYCLITTHLPHTCCYSSELTWSKTAMQWTMICTMQRCKATHNLWFFKHNFSYKTPTKPCPKLPSFLYILFMCNNWCVVYCDLSEVCLVLGEGKYPRIGLPEQTTHTSALFEKWECIWWVLLHTEVDSHPAHKPCRLEITP